MFLCAITSWLTAFGQDPRFIQTLRAVLRLQSALADCALGSWRPQDSAPVFFHPHSSHFRQQLPPPSIVGHASIMTLLHNWISASSSADQRRLVNWPPSWSTSAVIQTKSQPDCYTRQTLKSRLVGKDASHFIGLLHLYDAIREALTAGVLVVTPTFPIFTATAAAKMKSVAAASRCARCRFSQRHSF
jgi:hypothetical protein